MTNTDIVREILENLLNLMLIENYELQIREDSEENAIIVNIDTDDSPLLIGRHGAGLNSLQQLAYLILRNRDDITDVPRLRVDIGNYRENFEERIIELAAKKAERVMKEDIRETLHPMNAFHRRKVHLYIMENFPEIETDSIGNAPMKRITLSKKSKATSNAEDINID